uniref:hypothetical protein n=1 Tax=Orrella sp. TaxID=1921583 RepID=UPI0040476CB4
MRPRAYVFYDSKAQDLRRHRASGCHYRSDWTATANQFQAADYCGGVVFLDGLCGIVYAVARAAIEGSLTIVFARASFVIIMFTRINPAYDILGVGGIGAGLNDWLSLGH